MPLSLAFSYAAQEHVSAYAPQVVIFASRPLKYPSSPSLALHEPTEAEAATENGCL